MLPASVKRRNNQCILYNVSVGNVPVLLFADSWFNSCPRWHLGFCGHPRADGQRVHIQTGQETTVMEIYVVHVPARWVRYGHFTVRLRGHFTRLFFTIVFSFCLMNVFVIVCLFSPYRWVHLIFNLTVQLLVGLPLEMVHGSLRIGVVYMAGVLAGIYSYINTYAGVYCPLGVMYDVL